MTRMVDWLTFGGAHGRGKPHQRRCAGVLAALLLLATGLTETNLDERAPVPLDEVAPAKLTPAVFTETTPATEDVAWERAAAHFEAGAFVDALVEINRSLDQHGVNHDRLLLLGKLKVALGRLGEARAAFEHALAYRPSSFEAQRRLGLLHREAQRNEQATAHLLRAVKIGDAGEVPPAELITAWWQLGQSLADAGYLYAAAEALAEYDRRVQQASADVRAAEPLHAVLVAHPQGAARQRIDLLRRAGHADEATGLAEQLVRVSDAGVAAWQLYIETLLEAGQAQRALDTCMARLAEHPKRDAPNDDAWRSQLLRLAVDAATAAGQIDAWTVGLAARLSTADAAKADSRDADDAIFVAEVLQQRDRLAAATQLWQAIADARPSSADAAWALASLHHRDGNLAGALDSLMSFVRRQPDSSNVPLERLAEWFDTSADRQALLDIIERRMRSSEADFATYVVLGGAATAAGETAAAERLYRAAAEAGGDAALVHVAWGRLLLQQYQWDAARDQANAALALQPSLAAAHFIRGEALAALDDGDKAAAAYKAALESAPDNQVYRMALGRLYRQQDNLLSAQRYFQEAWSRDPANGAALEELIESYLSAGKIDIAEATLAAAEDARVPADVLRRARTAVKYAPQAMSVEHLAELRRQVEAHPDDHATALQLAAGLFLQRDTEAAAAVVEDVLEDVEPRDAASRRTREKALRLMAPIHLRQLEVERASTILEGLVERYPRREYTLQLLADAYLAGFEVDAARDVLRRILDLDLTEVARERYRLQLLGSYVDFGEFDTALAQVAEWIEAAPDNDTWPRTRMHILLTAGREEEAIERAESRLLKRTARMASDTQRLALLTKKAADAPDDLTLQDDVEDLREELAPQLQGLHACRSDYVQVLLETGEYERAEQRIRAWIAEGVDEPEYHEWLVEVLLAAKDGGAALEVLRTVQPRTPIEALQVYFWKARALAASGRAAEGAAELQSLLREAFIQNDAAARWQVRQQVIVLLVEAEQYQAALDLCAGWLATADANDIAQRFDVLAFKRATLEAAGRTDAALDVGRQMLALNPRDVGLNNDVGYTWADRGVHLDQAEAMIRLAVAAEPTNAAFLDSLGWVYYKQGRFEVAHEYLERAARLHAGRDAVIFDHLGDATYRRGDREAAERHWRVAADLLRASIRARGETPRARRQLTALDAKIDAVRDGRIPQVAPTAEEAAEDADSAEKENLS